jgi:hypothetical protein
MRWIGHFSLVPLLLPLLLLLLPPLPPLLPRCFVN